MNRPHVDDVVRLFGDGNPDTFRVVAPRYDELLVVAQQDAAARATVVYRSTPRQEMRVIQLCKEGHRWRVAAETPVPLAVAERTAPVRQLDYPERRFHFVPGSGEAPAWVDAERPTRAEAGAGP